MIRSTVHRDFLGANQTAVVFRCSLSLHVLVSTRAVATIVVITHCGTTIVRQKVVFLVVSAPEEFEGARVGVVANGLQNHIVAFLDSTVANIFHCLHERKCSAVSLLGLLLKVHGESTLVVDVVAGPEVHGDDPKDNEFGGASPEVWHLIEKLGSTLLTEVSVAEHW